MQQFVNGNVRVQFFGENIVRLEYAKNGVFCDADTFLVANKSAYADTEVAATKNENVICFGEYELYLPEEGRGLLGARIEKNGKKIYAYKKIANTGELPAPSQTPEAFAIFDTPRVIIPEGGYTYRGKCKNSGYKIEENVQDVYVLLCNKDAKLLRQLYVNLTGKSELVRLATLGAWNSKYFAYDENTAMQVLEDYKKHNFPLDNLVIDTDWRAASDRGIGYDVDTKLFPNMTRFLADVHKEGVEVMFNDHPEPVDGCDNLLAPEEVKYRETKLQSLMEMGLDAWWYDRNWRTKLKSPTKAIEPETFGLYLFDDVTRHFYQKQANSNDIYRRPVIMGNVDNIKHGTYHAIGNSASHRYSIQWTGDIFSAPFDLAQEIDNLIKGGNNCIAYINADIGGHNGNPDNEQYLRWIKFGVFSPVFRPHCTKTVLRFREPWLYGEEAEKITREYVNMRYRLLPAIYAQAYNNYQTGEPIFKELSYEYPTDKKAAKAKYQYMLGKNVMFAPFVGIIPNVCTRENYTTPIKATYYNGIHLEGAPIYTTQYETLNWSYNTEPLCPELPMTNFSARYQTSVKFEEDVELFILCDDGCTVYIDGVKTFEDNTLHPATEFSIGLIKGGKEHKIEIEYFQDGGEAACSLRWAKANAAEEKQAIYLPAGQWMDAFDGKIYQGGKTIYKNYPIEQTGLFIRLGALIPLANEAKNTREQKWDKLVYDFYPDTDACDSGFLYEDDGETTAYKFGQNRITGYKAEYDKENYIFNVTLDAPQGAFEGERACAEREITVRYHQFRGLEVDKVTVNGEEVNFTKIKKNKAAYPFATVKGSADNEVIAVTFTADVAQKIEIKFYV